MNSDDVPSGRDLERETFGTVRSILSGTNFSGNQEGVGVRRKRY